MSTFGFQKAAEMLLRSRQEPRITGRIDSQRETLFTGPDLMQAQEYPLTQFEWRTGVLDRQPLAPACHLGIALEINQRHAFDIADNWRVLRGHSLMHCGGCPETAGERRLMMCFRRAVL
jgi:hypothetical protein